MLELLKRQRVSDRLSIGLPEGTVMAHKTGNLANEAHDAGVIWTPFGPRIVVVLTSGWSAYEDVIELDRSSNEPLDLVVGGRVLARGEVVMVGDRMALRITEVLGEAGDRSAG